MLTPFVAFLAYLALSFCFKLHTLRGRPPVSSMVEKIRSRDCRSPSTRPNLVLGKMAVEQVDDVVLRLGPLSEGLDDLLRGRIGLRAAKDVAGRIHCVAPKGQRRLEVFFLDKVSTIELGVDHRQTRNLRLHPVCDST